MPGRVALVFSQGLSSSGKLVHPAPDCRSERSLGREALGNSRAFKMLSQGKLINQSYQIQRSVCLKRKICRNQTKPSWRHRRKDVGWGRRTVCVLSCPLPAWSRIPLWTPGSRDHPVYNGEDKAETTEQESWDWNSGMSGAAGGRVRSACPGTCSCLD